ncbi:hypothetical protein Ancab_038179 [Ancistrocladus abbreviatus]
MTVKVGPCVRENCADGTCLEASCSDGLSSCTGEHKATINRSLKDAEITAKSSERIYPIHLTSLSVKSDVTKGSGLSLNQMREELDTGADLCRLNNTKESLIFKAESCSSNSSHGIPSGPSHDKGHQEILVEVKSCKSRMNSHSPNKMINKVSKYDVQPVDVGNKASCSSSIDDVSGETVGLSSVDSMDPKKEVYLKETGEHIKPSSQLDTCDNSSPTQLLCSKNTERSQVSNPALVLQSKGNLVEQELSKVAQQTDRVAAASQSPHLCEFDLNLDMGANEVACTPKSIVESVSTYHKMNASEPIPVVAKIGLPVGLPGTPLQFDGELGWRTSAETSAFRPAKMKNSLRNKGTCNDSDSFNTGQSLSCRGIDLNIAFAADNLEFESAHNHVHPTLPTDVSSVEASSKESERPILDLNCQSENDDNHHLKSGVWGFDLNHKLSTDDSNNDVNQSSRSGLLSRTSVPGDTGASSKGTLRQSNYGSARPAYWVDLSSIPGFAHDQGQPFLVAARSVFTPTQQMQAAIPLQSITAPTPPGIYIGPTNSLPSAGYSPTILPHISGQHAASIVPRISGPVLAAYPGRLHLLESAPPNGYTNLRPSFVPGSGVTSLENGNRGAVMNDLSVPARSILAAERMKPVQQVASPPTSMKRREPEGGLDSCCFSLDGRPRGTRII